MSDHIYLAHHGIKGQKWGVRRFQNKDGSLTSAGKHRYGTLSEYRSLGRIVKGDVRAYGSSRVAKKAAKKKYWDREDRLEEAHDRVAEKIGKDLKSGKITKKEANRQWDSAWKDYTDASDASRKQYKADKRDIKTKRIEDRARVSMDESKRIQNEYKDTWRGRLNSDFYRGSAKIIQSQADVRRAKDAYKANKTPETRRAYHKAVANRVILANYSTAPSLIGAYDRYRSNGASAAQAVLKAGTMGSFFKHDDML